MFPPIPQKETPVFAETGAIEVEKANNGGFVMKTPKLLQWSKIVCAVLDISTKPLS